MLKKKYKNWYDLFYNKNLINDLSNILEDEKTIKNIIDFIRTDKFLDKINKDLLKYNIATVPSFVYYKINSKNLNLNNFTTFFKKNFENIPNDISNSKEKNKIFLLKKYKNIKFKR